MIALSVHNFSHSNLVDSSVIHCRRFVVISFSSFQASFHNNLPDSKSWRSIILDARNYQFQFSF